MSGAPDPQYVVGRSVLLDALDALGPQRQAAIPVGAQAIYLYTGSIDLAVAEFTTDGDITLDPTFDIAVAGPAALIVSKLHKTRERLAAREQRRLDDKDTLDVLRLLRAVPTEALAATFQRLLNHDLSKAVTAEALTSLKELFADPRGAGAQMAVRAAGRLADPAEIAQSCAALSTDLLRAIGEPLSGSTKAV